MLYSKNNEKSGYSVLIYKKGYTFYNGGYFTAAALMHEAIESSRGGQQQQQGHWGTLLG